MIELLVVLAIVALLASIAMPRYMGSLRAAREQALKESLRVMRVSIDRYYADRGIFPADLQELVNQRYLRAVPVDPLTENDQTWVLAPAPPPDTGVADIHSGASGNTVDGKAISEL